MSQLVKDCIASWHAYMPDWDYCCWDEETFLQVQGSRFKAQGFEEVLRMMNEYAYEAYQAKKYAFVSDYVRLWALERYGGLYLDTDVEVFKPFDSLMQYHAFAGFEGCKRVLVGTCVLASEPFSQWVIEQMDLYKDRHFFKKDGSIDMTTNVLYMTVEMAKHGFVQNGMEQDYKDLHVFPVDYFSPRHTTGEYIRTDNTYSDHLGLGSWTNKSRLSSGLHFLIGKKNMTRLIKLKRRLLK